MDERKHLFLRREKAAYELGANAISRIVTRGLHQQERSEIAPKLIPRLVNSEAHICCSDVDVTTTNIAFGRWAIPKLKVELLHSDPLIARRAIMTLLNMVHDPEKAVEAIRVQVIPRLVRLMISDDEFVRQHILMILEVLGMQPGGKLTIVKNVAIMRNLATLLRDPDFCVRKSAAKTLLSLASAYLGVDCLIKEGFITTTVKRLFEETDDDIKISLLETLELLLDQDMEAKRQGLDNEGLELAKLLLDPVTDIRARAAAVLSQLARHPDGKRNMLRYQPDILATLTDMLTDSEVQVNTHASAVLMYVLCMTEAKLRCLDLSTMDHLMNCAKIFRQPALQANAIKALTSLAESPEGQALLKTRFREISDIRAGDEIVPRHRDILLTVINRVI